MRFSEFFRLAHSQPALDFVDIDPDEDIPLFFDPYTFVNETDPFSEACASSLNSFFNTVIDCVRNQQHERGRALLGRLNEPNELCFGWSKGNPAGRGLGELQASQVYDKLAMSEAAKTGLLSDLAECELFIEGIGPDKISDVTANIIRGHLINYTQEQCELHGVPMDSVPGGPIWDEQELRWKTGYVRLPILNGQPVTLVPKRSVRWIGDLSHQHQKYYRHFVLNFLRDEHLRSNSGLVHVLRNGKKKVYKKDLEERYPLSKDFLFRFSRDNPQVFERYKEAYKKTKLIDISEIDEDFDVELFVDSLIERLAAIPYGAKYATDFQNIIVGILEFIFHPNLTNPKKEQPIHGGRKRIDITYANAARDGFFFRMHSHFEITSIWIIVECKNYSADPENPELDQLSGRFSPNRGRFGFLVARRFEDRERFLNRCRDTAMDNRGYILPLVDSDIIQMLTMIKEGRRHRIDSYLEELLRHLM